MEEKAGEAVRLLSKTAHASTRQTKCSIWFRYSLGRIPPCERARRLGHVCCRSDLYVPDGEASKTSDGITHRIYSVLQTLIYVPFICLTKHETTFILPPVHPLRIPDDTCFCPAKPWHRAVATPSNAPPEVSYGNSPVCWCAPAPCVALADRLICIFRVRFPSVMLDTTVFSEAGIRSGNNMA